ncbi:hypothetical protein PPERSA_06001 [Pseudocohnilembus persalinus]|uniref:RING-type domain-containing protein n=1 Tax=Pseudocohnilembus persalinus TaxID=266149 RepID=A0A0V0Q798_PSEPJ|nr:hypothetical protein PPERSA_06001 [Pseudocohnilembus persalinus]|eukprot:KRW98105.1 hypothetical protein PPERSA_06001 [Pseudocohnilembus persalinus]
MNQSKYSQLSENQITCSICYDNLEECEESVKLKICCHQFHAFCINTYIIKKLERDSEQINCPNCRQLIKNDQFPENSSDILPRGWGVMEKLIQVFQDITSQLNVYRLQIIEERMREQLQNLNETRNNQQSSQNIENLQQNDSLIISQNSSALCLKVVGPDTVEHKNYPKTLRLLLSTRFKFINIYMMDFWQGALCAPQIESI